MNPCHDHYYFRDEKSLVPYYFMCFGGFAQYNSIIIYLKIAEYPLPPIHSFPKMNNNNKETLNL